MPDKFTVKTKTYHRKIIKAHLDEIITYYGGINNAHEKLNLSKPTLWFWRTFKQSLEPKHAIHICSRCEIAELEKLIPQYKDLFK